MRLHIPDSGSFEFAKAPSVFELVGKAFPRKEHLTAGAFVNDSPEICDLRTVLKEGDKVLPVFIPSEQALEVVRHSSAHVMAQAVQELWPEVKVTIGPVIENGFYYDFDSPKTFEPKDLETIESKMKEIINRNLEVVKEVWPKKKAISFFTKIKEHYKAEIIEELEESEVSVYRQGGWLDLCRGPHVKNLKQIGAVKVLRLSGAYWRGDENKAQLQRIYGTAFHSEKDLKKHLHLLKEAEKRDHRRLAKEMDLFYFSSASPGAPFFTGRGAVIYNELIKFLRELYREYGYEEVITPQIFKEDLYSKSGHSLHFKENMYHIKRDQDLFLKPMNCPGHCLLYSFKKHSYRDLPWRLADFGRLHRNEKKGVLHGLTRVTSMCQDDAHIFCTPEQLKTEIKNTVRMFGDIYKVLGLDKYNVGFSTRPKNFMGELKLWTQAEQVLEEVLKELNIPFKVHPGEGAFYGPKLDFMFVDAVKRSWQLGTLQCDFNMPRAFELKYTDQDNKEKTPVLIHRAVLGSLERFIGVYLEHSAGRLPLWLSPVQAVLLNISQDQEEYVLEVQKEMKALGLRAEVDIRAEKLGYKIREARFKRVPCMIVAGEKEKSKGFLSVRLPAGDSLSVPKKDLIQHILKKAQDKSLNWEQGLADNV